MYGTNGNGLFTMTNPTTIRMDDEMRRQIDRLSEWWGDKNATSILRRAIEQAHCLEAARRNMTDSELLGYLADRYPAEGN